jgi:hypothetical protein
LALSLSRPLDRGEPPRGALWRGTASSYAVGSRRGGSAVRAAGCHLRVARRLTAPALACFDPAQHEGRRFFGDLAAPYDLRRLLTSRALRLGKPHRTFGPLTPSVVQGVRRNVRSLLRRFRGPLASAPYGMPHGPPHQIPTSPPSGLRTTAPPRPGRLPLVRSSTSRPKQTRTRSPFTACPRSPRTRSPTANRSSSSPRTAAGGYPTRYHSVRSAPARLPPCGFQLLDAARSLRRVMRKACLSQHLQPTTRHEHSSDRLTLDAPDP